MCDVCSDQAEEFPNEARVALIWYRRAKRNLEKWGLQGLKTLGLALGEEVGKVQQAILKYHHEGGDINAVAFENFNVAALCYQLHWRIQEELLRDEQAHVPLVVKSKLPKLEETESDGRVEAFGMDETTVKPKDPGFHSKGDRYYNRGTIEDAQR